MADDVKTEEEPSIEEILDSIRQIIADDDEEEAATEEVVEEVSEPEEPLDQSAIDDMDFDAPTSESEAEPDSEEESEPLDQSAIDGMDFDAPTPEIKAKPEPEKEDDVLELTDRIDEKPDMDIDLVEEEPEIALKSTPEPEENPQNNDDLLTKHAEEAAFAAISDLARKTAIDHSGVTLEDIVRSEIKPMLREWLDKNLPIIIERLVQEELERVSKRVLED